MRAVVRHSLATLLATTALGVVAAHAVDGDLDRHLQPTTGRMRANWSTNPTVPDGTATFTNTGPDQRSTTNGIVTIGTVHVHDTPIAPAYTITAGQHRSSSTAAGIINNSGNTQTFEVTSGNNLVFQNSSTASGGSRAVTITTIAGGTDQLHPEQHRRHSVTLTNNGFVDVQGFQLGRHRRRSPTTSTARSISSTTPRPAAPTISNTAAERR